MSPWSLSGSHSATRAQNNLKYKVYDTQALGHNVKYEVFRHPGLRTQRKIRCVFCVFDFMYDVLFRSVILRRVFCVFQFGTVILLRAFEVLQFRSVILRRVFDVLQLKKVVSRRRDTRGTLLAPPAANHQFLTIAKSEPHHAYACLGNEPTIK